MNVGQQPEILLSRISSSLERTVLNDLTSASANVQLKAALWTIGVIAGKIEDRAMRMREDIEDMEAVLAAFNIAWSRTNAVELQSLCEDELRQLHLRCQNGLVDLDRSIQADANGRESREMLTSLRGLYRRMLARDRDAGEES